MRDKIANNRFSDEKISKLLEDKGYEYIDSEYKKYDSGVKRLIIIKDFDGYMYKIHLNSFMNGRRANRYDCRNPYAKDNVNLNLSLQEENEYVICEKVYRKNGKTVGDFLCLKDGHKWTRVISTIINNKNGCVACGRSTTSKTIKIMNDIMERKSKRLVLSSDNVGKVGAHERLFATCLDCGFKFETCWNTINTANQICGNCNKHDNLGFYCVGRLRKNKDRFKQEDGLVYILKCHNDFSELFYKIGVTKNSVKKRFGKAKLPYEYEAICTFKNSLYDCILLENELHKKYKEQKYEPSIKFAGSTECFVDINIEEIKEYVLRKGGFTNGFIQ